MGQILLIINDLAFVLPACFDSNPDEAASFVFVSCPRFIYGFRSHFVLGNSNYQTNPFPDRE